MWGFTRVMRGMAQNVTRVSKTTNNINSNPIHNTWANL